MTVRRTPVPQRDAAPGTPSEPAFADDGAERPVGVEPWSGEEMPTGTASSHDLRAPGYAADTLATDSVDWDEQTEAEPAERGAPAENVGTSLPPEPEPLEISADDERN